MAQDYQATTRGVRVTVQPFYLHDRSNPEERNWFWAYRVRIVNLGTQPVQLMRRTWRITDGNGRVQEVHGAGVVGEQPLLAPGEEFEYTSGTPLDTSSGFMTGVYHMVIPVTGEEFDASIPTFSLDTPHEDTRLH